MYAKSPIYISNWRDVEEDRAQPIKIPLELHLISRLEGRVGDHPQAGSHEVRSWQVEKDRKVEVSRREVYRPDLHADSAIARPAISGRLHGPASEPIASLPGQHEADWGDPQEQLHHQY